MAEAAREWANWSGSLRVRPRRFVQPSDESEVASLVRDAHGRGAVVRTVAAGHSSHEMLVGDDVLLSTCGLHGVVATDRDARTAVVRPGTTLQDLGHALYEHDLALPNYGDVATQTIGGAIGTGTHGTGVRLPNLSAQLVAARLVDGRGDLHVLRRGDPRLRAARVALGALGVLTELTLALVPAFDVERREYATTLGPGLAAFDALSAGNRSVDFYWYPRRDDLKLRLVNAAGGGDFAPLPEDARLLERREGYSHLLIPTHSGIPHRFEESEFAVTAAAGLDCFRAVRERVLRRWRHVVGWRVLYRTLAADDAWLSPAQGRDTVTISLHQNASLPWREFFDDLEPVFLAFDGRPHWAKKHRLRADALAARYPHWDEFRRVRAQLDPDGTFATPALRALLGDVA